MDNQVYTRTRSPIGSQYFVAVSVATSTSAVTSTTSGAGGFLGVWCTSTCTLTFIDNGDNSIAFPNVQPGTILWVSGKYFTNLGSTTGTVIGIR